MNTAQTNVSSLIETLWCGCSGDEVILGMIREAILCLVYLFYFYVDYSSRAEQHWEERVIMMIMTTIMMMIVMVMIWSFS